MATDKWYIKGVFEAVDGAMKDRLQLIGELVASDARKNCPVGKYADGRQGGTLRNSITFDVDENKKLVIIGTNVEYAPFVELGSIHNIPKWFLTRAYNENLLKIRKIFSRKIKGF